jgi:hypothetical protein
VKQVPRETTTELAELREHPERFTWGEIIDIVEIGPYAIASYYTRKVDGCMVLRDIDHETVLYHVWVHGKNGCGSYHSLDAALAGAIAYRVEGGNHRADRYFILALNAIEAKREPTP